MLTAPTIPLDDSRKPANTPISKSATVDTFEREAFLELAKELADDIGISKDEKTLDALVSKLRWYPRGDPPAIVIVKRGADRKVLATISPKSGRFAHLYPSWRKVLTQLASEKAALRVSRLSHEGFEMGEVPLAKD